MGLEQRLNVLTGELEWVLKDDNDEYEEELVSSSYQDMLQDKERNEKYEQAIKKAVAKNLSRNEPCHVLDIGTGTGLLAMMAARAGAPLVTACESFEPMAKIAEKVLLKNSSQYSEKKINLLHKGSSELNVGVDMPSRADIIVMEIFDSELIGEGVIPTMNHAFKELAQPNCTVVPKSADIFILPFQSDILKDWHGINSKEASASPFLSGDLKTVLQSLDPAIQGKYCIGPLALIESHVDMLEKSMIPLSKPIAVKSFSFECPMKTSDVESAFLKMDRSGTVHGLVLWWDLHLDDEIVLSMAPKWIDPQVQWRDHWMQCLFLFPTPHDVTAGSTLAINLHHDEYKIWFDLPSREDPLLQQEASKKLLESSSLSPVCECGIHIMWSPQRIWMLNDLSYLSIFQQSVDSFFSDLPPSCVCYSAGDSSFLPFLLSTQKNVSRVYVVEQSLAGVNLMKKLISQTKNSAKIRIFDSFAKVCALEKIDVAVAEPYYSNAMLPADNLQFWFHCEELLQTNSLLKFFPQRASLYGAFVSFEFQHLTCVPADNVLGFDLSNFAQIGAELPYVESSQALWETSHRIVVSPQHLLDFCLPSSMEKKKLIKFAFDETCVCHGFVSWLDISLPGKLSYSTSANGNSPSYFKQGVHMFREPLSLSKGTKGCVQMEFDSSSGLLNYNFVFE